MKLTIAGRDTYIYTGGRAFDAARNDWRALRLSGVREDAPMTSLGRFQRRHRVNTQFKCPGTFTKGFRISI